MISNQAEQGTLFQGYEFVWIKVQAIAKAKHTWQPSIHHSAASAEVWGGDDGGERIGCVQTQLSNRSFLTGP